LDATFPAEATLPEPCFFLPPCKKKNITPRYTISATIATTTLTTKATAPTLFDGAELLAELLLMPVCAGPFVILTALLAMVVVPKILDIIGIVSWPDTGNDVVDSGCVVGLGVGIGLGA